MLKKRPSGFVAVEAFQFCPITSVGNVVIVRREAALHSSSNPVAFSHDTSIITGAL